MPAYNKRNRCTTDFTGFKTSILPNLYFGSGKYEHLECGTCCRIANPAGRIKIQLQFA